MKVLLTHTGIAQRFRPGTESQSLSADDIVGSREEAATLCATMSETTLSNKALAVRRVTENRGKTQPWFDCAMAASYQRALVAA
jgi:hypothetical protein